jgi:hypothetical protein
MKQTVGISTIQGNQSKSRVKWKIEGLVACDDIQGREFLSFYMLKCASFLDWLYIVSRLKGTHGLRSHGWSSFNPFDEN